MDSEVIDALHKEWTSDYDLPARQSETALTASAKYDIVTSLSGVSNMV